ncbi:hypothetical protein [Marinobacter bohaiensis]|uniref:hypothetical protein n=1 Tax=Marinobacter bohaiensis TaxID=2201898 RepID=UPI000DAD7778|nr:hypothetical protein [Marinobacter bohaiensis]
MKKLFLSLLGLLLLAYVGFKGAAWFQVNRGLTHLQTELASQGSLSWGRIGSSLSGQISIYDVEYRHFAISEPVRATRLTFETGGTSALLESLAGGPLPSHWQLHVENLNMALASPLLTDWVAPGHAAAVNRAVVIPCGNGQLDLASLMALGVDRIAGDLRIQQTPPAQDGDHGGLQVDLQAGKLGSMELQLPALHLRQAQLEDAAWRELPGPVVAVLRDGGFMRRLAAYCAREGNQSPEQWASRATADFAGRLQASHHQMSDQLRALYKVWLRDGGELKATLWPGSPLLGLPRRGEPVTGDGVEVEAPERSFDVFYNGARVPDLFVSHQPPAPESVVAAPAEEAPAVPDDAVTYRPTAPEQAERWLGRDVRATLQSGRVVDGRLSGIDDRRLEVTRIVDGGAVAYPLARSAITLFEVRRRQNDTGREPETPDIGSNRPKSSEQESREAPDDTAGTEAGEARDGRSADAGAADLSAVDQ